MALPDSPESFLKLLHQSDNAGQIKQVTELFKSGQKLKVKVTTLDKEIARLQLENLELKASFNTLQNQIQIWRDENAGLQRQLAVAQYKLENQPKDSDPSTSANKPKPSVTTEFFHIREVFLGNDKTKYDRFKKHIKITIAQNPERFRTV